MMAENVKLRNDSISICSTLIETLQKDSLNILDFPKAKNSRFHPNLEGKTKTTVMTAAFCFTKFVHQLNIIIVKICLYV